MKYIEKRKAVSLRKSGMTISEISRIISVSKSTVSTWVENINLSNKAKNIIENKITAAQMKSRQVLRNKALKKKNEIENFSQNLFKKTKISKITAILLCSCLYEGEGGKGKGQSLSFTNSDPKLVSTFLKLFRKSFDLDESKFRVCVHLHDYHNEKKQLKFWSNITKIPLNQFIKSFKKKNTGIYKKDGYEGCVSIRYYDISIKNKLLSIFQKIESNL